MQKKKKKLTGNIMDHYVFYCRICSSGLCIFGFLMYVFGYRVIVNVRSNIEIVYTSLKCGKHLPCYL